MADAYIDTNILIRFLTGDDPTKRVRSTALFEKVEKGELSVFVPLLVLAETVYVLSSPRLYHVPREQIYGMLSRLLHLPHFKVRNRRRVLKALDLYLASNLDFEDAYIAVSMLQTQARVLYSYDTGFDRVPGITRREP